MDQDTKGQPLETILRTIAEPFRKNVEARVIENFGTWKGLFAENLEKVIQKRASAIVKRLADFDAKLAAGQGYYADKSAEEIAEGRKYAGMLNFNVNIPGLNAYGMADAYNNFKGSFNSSRKDYKMQKAAESKFSFMGDFDGDMPVLKADLDEKIAQAAKEEAEAAISGFLMKSLHKFGKIVEAKGGAVETFAHGMDMIRFVFEDGTTFRVTNSQILNVSVLGTVFNQWPTRFHDVVLADGSKMKAPSEKKLKDLFKGKA